MKPYAQADTKVRELLDRLHRIAASEDWEEDLNPAQTAALSYLTRANRFSRSPSVVADYLGATRGTVSQTLKALLRKGLISESSNPTDRRSISYEVTEAGFTLCERRRLLDKALDSLPKEDLTALEDQLRQLLGAAVEAHGLKTFGACKTCRHHERRDGMLHCGLLDLQLQENEAEQICFEHHSL